MSHPTEQPIPTPGRVAVAPLLDREYLDLSKKRYEKGVQTYGTPLMTHNGRDAGLDAMEEWYDLGAYLKQQRIEHDDLKFRLSTAVSNLNRWLADGTIGGSQARQYLNNLIHFLKTGELAP